MNETGRTGQWLDGPGEWDGALSRVMRPAPLLQTWAYGDVQGTTGWRVERLRLGEEAQAQVLLGGRGRLAWAYVPRGPVPPVPSALAELARWARDRRLARLRVDAEAPAVLAADLRALGFRPGRQREPRHTLLVPLAEPERMLAGFKPKHRYNIRLAQRRGVEVEEGRDAAELHRQSVATRSRQGISLPGEAYYRGLLERLPWCRTYVARHHGEALAAILVARHDGRAYYLFGGSSGAHRELMPSYAVQWAAMQAAWSAGCRDYDLWGLPPAPDPSHPWFGLWQFKTGFGGQQVEYVGSWDLRLAPSAAAALAALEKARQAARRARKLMP